MSTFKTPPVGSVVTVTVRSKNHYYYRTQDYTDTVYENVPVIKPFPWTKPGEFCIPAVGEPHITVRTITMDSVIALTVHGKEGEVHTDTDTTFVEVPGSGNKTYRVTVVAGVAKSCECLGFQYRKECRHLRQAMGETPVNPRRSARRKPAPVQQELKLAPRPKTGVTKAELVRGLIQAHKVVMSQDMIVDMVAAKLGFTKSLAATYVRNNWSKV